MHDHRRYSSERTRGGVCWQDGNSCEETQRGLKAGLVVAAQKHQVQSSSIAPWERREFASMQRKVPFA
ncbi:hypothetical protein EYF80_040641 [Liparis tanakae]|uniref:Uncharacterized protein n=1 Tax=Liparis tanakae TaxID=230148 RepID=A0A4Z2G863_9TELE|nr:hypothetical protein EYF80_040641 [Liparis tanakae]